MYVVPDKLLINLRILSKLQKNGRITRSYDGIIFLERNDTFFQALKRFLASDSRKQTVFEINSIVSECYLILFNILNAKHMSKECCETDEFVKGCESLQLLLNEMTAAKVGIENLKHTYQTDQNIISQLDIILLKMNSTIKDVNVKLQGLMTFLKVPLNPENCRLNQSETQLQSVKIEEPSETSSNFMEAFGVNI